MEIIVDFYKHIEETERNIIDKALIEARGNKTQASKLLCLNRTTLTEKMKKLKMEVNKYVFKSEEKKNDCSRVGKTTSFSA